MAYDQLQKRWVGEHPSPPTQSPALSSGLATLTFIAILNGLLACGAEPTPTPEPIRPIKILKIGDLSDTRSLEYPGIIESARHARMACEVPGRMIEFPVVEGDRLKEGDLIARLDPRDYQETLDKQKANAEYMRAELDRREELYQAGVDSKQLLDKAQKNYDVAMASVAQAEKSLEDTQLRAPFDGVVAVKLVKDFRNVQAKEQVVVFEDNSYLKIAISLPEIDYVRLTPGLSLEERNSKLDLQVVFSSLPDRKFPARITDAANTADPITRTFRVTLSFRRPTDVAVTSGMTARVVVSARNRSHTASGGFLIPVQATRSDESGNSFVWILDPASMAVDRSPVKLGEVSGSMIQVIEGLDIGDEVAISGVAQLREGMRVRRLGG